MTFSSLKPIGYLPHFPGAQECYQSTEGYIYTKRYGGKKQFDALQRDFIAREDDIFIVGFPKTGTSWLQEIVYLIISDLDYETAKTTKLLDRCPVIEVEGPGIVGWDVPNNLKSPRFLKSHYPYSLLPMSIIDKNCKLIYPVRNPKDTVVSYYFFAKSNIHMDFDSDLSTFVEDFVEDKVVFGPYWKHVTEFWKRRNNENILIITYEDMKKDFVAVLMQICKFLGKSYSQEELHELTVHCSFSEMKKNPAASPVAKECNRIMREDISEFMRKGQVGDWKNHLTEEMNKQLDDYVEKHFGGTDLKFVYELEEQTP